MGSSGSWSPTSKRRRIYRPISPPKDEVNICLQIKESVSDMVDRYKTVKDLKDELSNSYGYHEKYLELLSNGEILRNDKTLLCCGVRKDCNLRLVVGDTRP